MRTSSIARTKCLAQNEYLILVELRNMLRGELLFTQLSFEMTYWSQIQVLFASVDRESCMGFLGLSFGM